MLRKFVNWLHKRMNRLPYMEYDFYSPMERVIYSYFDGQTVVQADPMMLFRKLAVRQQDMALWARVADSQSKDAVMAEDKFLEHVRAIFGVKPFEGGGLTVQETKDLLDHFYGYCVLLKKNSSGSSTTAGATSVPTGQPTSVSSAESSPPPPTRNTSPSGSSSEEPSTDSPLPSPSDVVSP